MRSVLPSSPLATSSRCRRSFGRYPDVHPLMKDAIVLSGACHQLLCDLRVRGQRLFTEHMLARLERPPGPQRVQRGRQRDIHRIDALIVEERGIRSECPGNLVSVRKRPRFRERS